MSDAMFSLLIIVFPFFPVPRRRAAGCGLRPRWVLVLVFAGAEGSAAKADAVDLAVVAHPGLATEDRADQRHQGEHDGGDDADDRERPLVDRDARERVKGREHV